MIFLLAFSPVSAINFETTTYTGEISQKQTGDIQTSSYTGLSTHIEPMVFVDITTVDTTEPLLTINTPTEDQNISDTDRIDFNVSYIELYPDTCILVFDSINYSMTIDTTNKECTVTLGNIVDGTYPYYVWMNDTVGNDNQTSGSVMVNYTADWSSRISGGGGGVFIPPKPVIIFDDNLTVISPPTIKDRITLDVPKEDIFSISNIDNTSTMYNIYFDCTNYSENHRLCPYINFIDTIYGFNKSISIDIPIDEVSIEYIKYQVIMPKYSPLTTYYADIVVMSDKGETLILPIEYRARSMMTISEFIGEYKYLLVALSVFLVISIFCIVERNHHNLTS
ncbi:MAG: hypothetical protein KAS32_17965 [Candidatus Peribacteraceae bacterium]|nr:hypothetical protein [Candidatus Peribacteraceae bacterium]